MTRTLIPCQNIYYAYKCENRNPYYINQMTYVKIQSPAPWKNRSAFCYCVLFYQNLTKPLSLRLKVAHTWNYKVITKMLKDNDPKNNWKQHHNTKSQSHPNILVLFILSPTPLFDCSFCNSLDSYNNFTPKPNLSLSHPYYIT